MNTKTYVSLFSCAGVGCYGFHVDGWECISTCELKKEYLNIQKINQKCKSEYQYICGDLSKAETQEKVVHISKQNLKGRDLDVVFATPPCQSMSVLNRHNTKQKDTIRNSLVVDSLKLIKELNPKVFIIENVKSFLTTMCVNKKGDTLPIGEAILNELGELYTIESKVLNLKDYGSQSSRTRTIVIGSRKSENIDPNTIFPSKVIPSTVEQLIGHLEPLTEMGQISKTDIWHRFRPYKPIMRSWIKDLLPGESAFDNECPKKRPHRIVNGVYKASVKGYTGKYKRVRHNEVAPCIHTRSDTFSSQSTIHPFEDRVFSVRELMLMMTIPHSFQWATIEDLQKCRTDNKYYNSLERKIRTVIGEAVPTNFILRIAKTLKSIL